LTSAICWLLYLAMMSAGAINWLTLAPETPSDLDVQSVWGVLLESARSLSFAGVPMAIGAPSSSSVSAT